MPSASHIRWRGRLALLLFVEANAVVRLLWADVNLVLMHVSNVKVMM